MRDLTPEEKKAQGESILRMIAAAMSSGSSDPAYLLRLAIQVALNSDLDPSVLNEIKALYMQLCLETLSTFVGNMPMELKEEGEELYNNSETMFKLLDFLENKYNITIQNNKYIDEIEKDPNSPQAIKAVKKLVEDFANPEEFKKRCIEAKSELKEVNDLLGKITKQYEKLKNQSSQEESTLITLENMIKHFKEKIHTLEHAFGRETKAYLQYLETRLEVGHDAPEEVIEDKLREKIKMSKGEEKIEVKEFASVMNNAQGNKDIGNEFDKFMSAYQEKVKEKIESKQELQSKEKETTAELDRKSSDQIKESIKLSGVSTNNEDKVLKHTTDKSETTTSAKENNELNEKNKKVFGKFSGKVVKERESKINRSDAKDPDNPKSPSK